MWQHLCDHEVQLPEHGDHSVAATGLRTHRLPSATPPDRFADLQTLPAHLFQIGRAHV